MADRLKLDDVALALSEMHLRGVIGKYAVGGASAVAFYTEPLATKDLDIFFVFEPPQNQLVLSLEPIYEFCREKGYSFDHEFISIGGWPVQFVECSHDKLWNDAISNSNVFNTGSTSIYVLPPDHLAAMWASVARSKDIVKIQHFIETNVLDPAKLHSILVEFGLVESWRKIQGVLPDEFKF